MKAQIIMSIIMLSAFSSMQAQDTNFYSFTVKNIDGGELSLEEFKGKKVLIVNVASKCGFTYQYEDLEKLQNQYAEKLIVVGLPCNQFLGQEPGSEEQIASFCSTSYGVSFPMTTKIDVKGKNQHPLYQWL